MAIPEVEKEGMAEEVQELWEVTEVWVFVSGDQGSPNSEILQPLRILLIPLVLGTS